MNLGVSMVILLINVFISNTPLGLTKYDRGLLKPDSRYDIFKYELASYSVINWDKVVLYVELDSEYSKLYCDLDKYIESLFSNVIIHHYRNSTLPQWRESINNDLSSISEDEFIWFSCNDDHIFIDYNLDLLNEIEQKMKELLKSYEYVSCGFTHFPEAVVSLMTINENYVLERNENYSVFMSKNPGGSIQIINKGLLDYWIFRYNYIEKDIRRTDDIVDNIDTINILPHREMVRHYDGYGHNAIDINSCPPLVIPKGFFENKVKIAYGFEDNIQGYVNINPTKDNFTAVDKNGTDYKLLITEIPLFWHKHIEDIKISDNIDENVFLKKRNEWMLSMLLQLVISPIEKIIKILPNVFTKRSSEEMINYLNSDALKDENLNELGIQIYKRNTKRKSVKTSIIILDKSFIAADSLIKQLVSQMKNREEYEIILVEICQMNYAINIKEMENADWILRYTCNELNKNVALNVGAIVSKGENLLFLEINYHNLSLSRKFIASLNINKYEQKMIKTAKLYDIVSEGTTFEEISYKPYVLKDKDLICVVAMTKQLFFEFGGFDEDNLFEGSNGGVYEMISRAKASKKVEITEYINLLFNIIYGKPCEIVPINKVIQKIFSPSYIEPQKVNRFIQKLQYF